MMFTRSARYMNQNSIKQPQYLLREDAAHHAMIGKTAKQEVTGSFFDSVQAHMYADASNYQDHTHGELADSTIRQR